MVGSSPHARGALPGSTGRDGHARLIPACAGSTVLYPRTADDDPAHPRMRGEHDRHPYPRGVLRGLIPACAGSTRPLGASSVTGWAHPRMRGEHLRPAASRPRLLGSSPHARGAQRCRPLCAGRVGLIPACAGSTCPRWPRKPTGRAHPRMRGEHRKIAETGKKVRGSSPHARGARAPQTQRDFNRRLIPACAGSTVTTIRRAMPGEAHPRMRGEHSDPINPAHYQGGSSPHARGAR